MTGYRLSVDVGGTFTDLVARSDDGWLTVAKTPTTPDRAFTAIAEGVSSIERQLELPGESLLGKCHSFVYATTRATNAIIEGTTARTALITTRGFADILLLREGGKSDAFDFTVPTPEPYIPRRLTFEVDERVDAQGDVVTALEPGSAGQVLDSIAAIGVDAVGVCLLWSTANPAHEELLGELISSRLPFTPFTLSHELNPIVREYRRASSTAIDASLKPLMQEHLRDLADDLEAGGFRGRLMAATSTGGLQPLTEMAKRPILAIRSGPAMGPVAGRAYAQRESIGGDLVVCDAGGTSFDVSVVRDGAIAFTRETWLGARFVGHMTGLSAVDARSVGSGGGSIAWLDDGGLLRIGPRSAGAAPGPVLYGRGGVEPTVTDAAAVLGLLDLERFAGGQMSLDADAARSALDGLADQLGETRERAAHTVLQMASLQMVAAIHEMTIKEGLDPRHVSLVVGGGATGLLIVAILRELKCPCALLPRTAGVLSADGAQVADVVADFAVSLLTRSRAFDHERVSEALCGVIERAERFGRELEGYWDEAAEVSLATEARYQHQVWEIEIPVPTGRLEPAGLEELEERFHAEHDRLFAVRDPGSEIEFLTWKARLTAPGDASVAVLREDERPQEDLETQSQPAWLDGLGWVDVPLLAGGRLARGQIVDGPAVIAEPTSTLVLDASSRARVTDSGNYLVEV